MNKYKLALFVCAFAWGFGYVSMDHLVETTSVAMAIGLRFTFASLIILVVGFKSIKQEFRGNILNVVILGSVLFLAFLFQTVGLSLSTTSKNAFLTATNVVWVPVILSIFYNHRIQKKIYISSIIMIVGVAFVSLDGISAFNIGDVSTLIGAIFFALHMVLIGKFTNLKNLNMIVFGQLFVTGILGLIATLMIGDFTIVFGNEFVLSFLFAIFFSTSLCFFLQNYGIAGVDASIGALILSLEAMFGVIATVLIDGEMLNLITITGFGLMFLAIVIAEYRT